METKEKILTIIKDEKEYAYFILRDLILCIYEDENISVKDVKDALKSIIKQRLEKIV